MKGNSSFFVREDQRSIDLRIEEYGILASSTFLSYSFSSLPLVYLLFSWSLDGRMFQEMSGPQRSGLHDYDNI